MVKMIETKTVKNKRGDDVWILKWSGFKPVHKNSKEAPETPESNSIPGP